MVIIPTEQINRMVDVMEDIISPRGKNVGDIKKKHNLTSDEYDMIMDLCMPRIRHSNGVDYWKNNYLSMRNQIYERLRQEDYGNKLATDISQILQGAQVGRKRKELNDITKSA